MVRRLLIIAVLSACGGSEPTTTCGVRVQWSRDDELNMAVLNRVEAEYVKAADREVGSGTCAALSGWTVEFSNEERWDFLWWHWGGWTGGWYSVVNRTETWMESTYCHEMSHALQKVREGTESPNHDGVWVSHGYREASSDCVNELWRADL